jgi:tol-pal system protein YbgF
LDERQEVSKLQARQQQLENRLQELHSAHDELKVQIADLRYKLEGVRDLALKNSRLLTAQSPSPAPAKPKPEPKPEPAAAVPTEKGSDTPGSMSAESQEAARVMYQQALGHYKNGSFDQSISLFKAFLQAYPKHEMAANARYWLGENFYSLAEFAQAITEFKRVVEEYPASTKTAGCLLKIGMSFQAIGIDDQAKEYFQRVLREFPESASAELARRKLEALSKV